MRVLVAPDKFAGSMTAVEAAEAIGDGLRAAGAEVDLCPIADGGEGTLDALVAAMGGRVMGVIARGPIGVPVRAHLGTLSDGTGVVELAQASGLSLVPEAERDPMRASTHGTGELIKGALARRPPRIVVALGGSATVDGGMGLGRALGLRFTDAGGEHLPEGGGALAGLGRIDNARLDPRLIGLPILVAADVMSPLTGPDGAARVFGPQKGATPEMVEALDAGLRVLGERIEADLHVPVLERPGAGSAGGAGAMLMGLGGEVRSGAEVVLDAAGFAERLERADLVVTGEGRLDESTIAGKGPAIVARRAAEAGVPCHAIVGEATVESDLFSEVRTLIEHAGDLEQAMARAPAAARAVAARLFSRRRFG